MGSDWKIIKLGQIADVKGGKRLPKGELLQSGKNDHPYIRITDIENGEINARNLLFVPDSVFPIIKNYTVDGGNIIITIVGTIGLVTTIPNDLSGASLTENAAKIIPKDDTIWPDYLAYFLKSNMGQNEVKKNIVGSTQPKLPFYGIQNIDVMLPPIEEQKRIAYILGTLDDKIELNQRMNETLEAMARALFKAWFVDFEAVKAKMNGEPYPLPDEIMDLFPDELVESELGLIPKGWKISQIGELSDVTSGSRPLIRNPNYVKDKFEIPLYGGAGIMSFTNSPNVTQFAILTGRVGTLNKKFLINLNIWASDNTLLIIPNNEKLLLYLYHSLELIDLTVLNRGSTQPLLTQTDLKKINILTPTDDILSKFELFINPLFTLISSKTRENKYLIKQRENELANLIN